MRRAFLSPIALRVVLFLFAAVGPNLRAQTGAPRFPFAAHPEPTAVYADSTVPRVDLWIPADTLQLILSDVTSDREWRARFRWQGNGLRDSVGLVGFRLKGNTSRYSGKKSFKISFNTFTPGTRWQGVKDLNLNGEHNDPSIARARISWNLAQRMGLAAARVNHVELYINGSYFGVYANVEHINDDYVQHRYGTDDGNLYKCLYPAPLQFLSTNPNAYKFVSGGRRAYELKTNTEADDYSDLAAFIQVLNQTPSAQLECALDTLLDVNEYLLTLAVEISLGHWDNYAVNNNNYYLYRSPHDGRFHFLLYDLDNTLGIDWFGTDWTSKNVYQWGNTSYPLYGRLLSNLALRQRFTYYLKAVNDALYAPDFRQKILQIRDQIATSALTDPYRPADYGYTFQQFNLSYTTATGAHVKEGILPYLSKRQQSTTQQLGTPTGTPLFRTPVVQASSTSLPLNLSTAVDAAVPLTRVGWIWNADTSAPTNANNRGTQSDTAWLTLNPATQRWTGSLLLPPNTDQLRGQFYAQTTANRTATWPCTPRRIPLLPNLGLVLNEISPRGADFIELYHRGTDPLDLAHYALSNDSAGTDPYPLPQNTVQPGEMRCIDLSDTTLRPFGLNAAGEWLVLLYRQDSITPYLPVDAQHFPSVPANSSFARMTDGHPVWGFTSPPTPCAPNRPRTTTPADAPLLSPNPHGTSLSLFNPHPTPLTVRAHTATGQLLGQWTVPALTTLPLTDSHAPGLRIWTFTADGLYLQALRTLKVPD